MAKILLTGFPGFLGSALVPRLLERTSDNTTIICLIQQKFRVPAESKIQAYRKEFGASADRIKLAEGDITVAGLGLEQTEIDREQISEIYHLAAIYDLGVSRDLAMKVNFDGTNNMLYFAEQCPNLQRFQYVSTCYVSGRYEGSFSEQDLDVGQSFNNYYEETKYLAEVEVQNKMRQGMPTTIYRPAVVTGDSRTGATQKYDGPYYVIQWILRQPAIAVLPVIGNPKEYTFNVVPSNFVIDAIHYLSSLEQSKNKVYQLCDPDPLTVDGIIRAISDATDKKIIRIPLTQGLAKGALKHIPGVYRLMKIEPEAVNYFTHPTRYTCNQTLRDLQDSEIQCPRFDEYLDVLIDFMRQNPQIKPDAMV